MSAPWPVVQRGHESEAVATVQLLLRHHGYDLEPDGEFAAGTDDAVRGFQRGCALVVDGVVGDQTWSRLIIAVRHGDEGDAVVAVQRALAQDGAGGADIRDDGCFGSETAAAVRAFQAAAQDRGDPLRVDGDGDVGPATWHALVSAQATWDCTSAP